MWICMLQLLVSASASRKPGTSASALDSMAGAGVYFESLDLQEVM